MSALSTPRLESGWLDDTPVDDNLIRRFARNQGDLGATGFLPIMRCTLWGRD